MSSPAVTHSTTEEPDLILWRIVGDVSEADVARLYALQAPFCQNKPHVLVLVDVRRMGRLSVEARHAAARGPFETMPVRGVALVGASFHLRVVGTMINKAAAFVHRIEQQPMRFFDTEPEARAWFAERRRELALPRG